ncbi:MAG: rhodanese-like domain-containing protein [Candidatus Xenobia bacterium]
MQDILEAYPSAQRALFQAYHIGGHGCSRCSFDPRETLQEVLSRHRVLDVQGAVNVIKESAEVDRKLQCTVQEAAALLKGGQAKLIDVRPDFEADMASIEGALPLTQELGNEMMRSWAKDTAIIFHCHTGVRSLEYAAYFAGHGFTQAKSMAGGIDAWSEQIDAKVPRY